MGVCVRCGEWELETGEPAGFGAELARAVEAEGF